MKKVKFIEVKSELGAGTRGASMAVDALKIAALDYGSNLFNKIQSVEVAHENQMLFDPPGSHHAKRIKGVMKVCSRVAAAVKNMLRNDEFPLVLAGDHSTAIGSIAGIRMAYPQKRIGVIWIDAHADLHSPWTTPSGNMHGMTLAAVLGEDNLSNKMNKPDKDVLEQWNNIKRLAGTEPMIHWEDVALISLRDMEPEEAYLLKKHNVKVFSTNDVKRNGVEKIARDTLTYLSRCNYLYISFDVDSMESSISRGTGTPVRNGITEKEAGSLLVHLIQNTKVFCFEIAEINPTLDKENLMAENSFEILQRVVSQLVS